MGERPQMHADEREWVGAGMVGEAGVTDRGFFGIFLWRGGGQ